MKTKDIIYTCFLEASNHTTNIYWKTIFEDLSYGICPFGIYISRDFLCCNFKGKEFSYKIDKKKEPELLFKDVRDLFVNNLSLCSHTDKINIEYEQDNYHKKWSNIRKKNIRDTMIDKYVILNKEKYNLTYKQCKNLISIIFIGLIFKVITAKDIIFSEKKITNINGIVFTDKKIQITFDIYSIKTETAIIPEPEFTYMAQQWNKYLEKLR